MTTPDPGRASGDDRRLLETLQRVLAIQELDLRGALTQACNLIAETLRADKVDVFLYVAESETLVALGTSTTDLGRRQHRIGMERQPIANGGVAARVFQSGEPYQTGHADKEADQLRGMIEGLGVRSEISVPFGVHGERRGVLSAVSLQPEFFIEADLPFLQAVASWIGMVTQRAELFEQATREATRRGRRDAAEELARLTRRQQEVAICLAEGLSNAEHRRAPDDHRGHGGQPHRADPAAARAHVPDADRRLGRRARPLSLGPGRAGGRANPSSAVAGTERRRPTRRRTDQRSVGGRR